MEILIKALQLIVALVLLVTIHEFGHYFFARLFGVKVNRFYLFFNPKFSLVRWNPRKHTVELIAWNTKDGDPKAALTIHTSKKTTDTETPAKPTWRDTVYGLGWIPLGGYCDIAGMIDETKGADTLAEVPQPWEFRTKAAWKRLCVMVAGVVFNFLLAIVIYIGMAFHYGRDVIPFRAMTEGMDFSPSMQSAGFQNGDIIYSVNGVEPDPTSTATLWDLFQPGTEVTVKRGDHFETIQIPEGTMAGITAEAQDHVLPMSARIPVVVARTMPGGGAQEAGLQPGDRIVEVGDTPTPSFGEFTQTLHEEAGTVRQMKIISREGDERIAPVAINENGKIGIQLVEPSELFDHQVVQYTLWESIPRGVGMGWEQLVTYVKSLKMVFTREGATSLGGFGTLGDLFPSLWNWKVFWTITAFLSIILAFMNIIPIPGLDGGHTLFLLIEMVSGRKLSPRAMEIVNTAGFAFLVLLLVYANGNDIYRFFIK